MRLILGSASPRRRDLLSAAGFVFEVVPVDLDERPLDGELPDGHVERLARAKARAVAARHPGATVLGADTIVAALGRILGKPASDADARAMLEALSGRWHEVLTGVAVRRDEREAWETTLTRVHFLPLSAAEVDSYIAAGEHRDKAGAYAIQGYASRFVDRIEGSCSNVVGLPITSVCRLLERVGPGTPGGRD